MRINLFIQMCAPGDTQDEQFEALVDLFEGSGITIDRTSIGTIVVRL